MPSSLHRTSNPETMSKLHVSPERLDEWRLRASLTDDFFHSLIEQAIDWATETQRLKHLTILDDMYHQEYWWKHDRKHFVEKSMECIDYKASHHRQLSRSVKP